MKAQKLPLFEGDEVTETQLAITGKITSNLAQPPRPLHLGDEVIALVVGHVIKVGHQTTDEGLARAHTVKLREVLELDEGEAAVLLSEARAKTQAAIDELLGRQSFDFPPSDQTGEVE